MAKATLRLCFTAMWLNCTRCAKASMCPASMNQTEHRLELQSAKKPIINSSWYQMAQSSACRTACRPSDVVRCVFVELRAPQRPPTVLSVTAGRRRSEGRLIAWRMWHGKLHCRSYRRRHDDGWPPSAARVVYSAASLCSEASASVMANVATKLAVNAAAKWASSI